MKTKLFFASVIFIIIGCSKKEPEITIHKSKMVETNSNVAFGEVFNKIDPICNMETKNHVSDTAYFDNKTYGFCSVYCKDEFKKNPRKYVKK